MVLKRGFANENEARTFAEQNRLKLTHMFNSAIEPCVYASTCSIVAETFSTLTLLVFLKSRVASMYCPGTNPVVGILICTSIEPLKQQRL